MNTLQVLKTLEKVLLRRQISPVRDSYYVRRGADGLMIACVEEAWHWRSDGKPSPHKLGFTVFIGGVA